MLISEESNEALPVVYDISHYDLGTCEITGIYILHDCKVRGLTMGQPALKQHENKKHYIYVSIWYIHKHMEMCMYYLFYHSNIVGCIKHGI